MMELLDTVARRVYSAALLSRDCSEESLTKATGLDQAQIEQALSGLQALGLLRVDPEAPSRLVAVNPDAASRHVLAREEEQIAELQRRVAGFRDDMSLFMADYLAARRLRSDFHAIEVVEGLDNVRSLLEDLADVAQRRVLSMQSGGSHDALALRSSLPLDRQALERGVAMQTLFQEAARSHKTTREYVTQICAWGAQVRVAPTLPTRLLIIDDDLTVLPMNTAATHAGACLVRSRVVTQAVALFFELHWSKASEFAGAHVPLDDSLTDYEREALRLLASGKKDEVAARQLGVSLRTFRRSVASLMERLHASTRFQAGAEAASRDWV